MTTTDPRPPLYLTSSEATNWFSLHSEDIGREIVIREWKPAPVPPEYAEAWRGFGRWVRGMHVGIWPQRTFFWPGILERPSSFATVIGSDVFIKAADGVAHYRLWEYPYAADAPRVIREFLEAINDGRRPADLVEVLPL